MKRFILNMMLLVGVASAATAAHRMGEVATKDVAVTKAGDRVAVSADIVLDSLYLSSGRQVYVTPLLSAAGHESVALPSLLVSGKGMYYAVERGVVKAATSTHPQVYASVKRNNGKPQTVSYVAAIPTERWMYSDSAVLSFSIDSCGCGDLLGSEERSGISLNLNPASRMSRSFVIPKVTPLPVSVHEGRARVQFEVDRTILHTEPYLTRKGERIDNTAQLAVIDDSIRKALDDPNVEIASIEIVGLASPESSYIHNEQLATGRSRALAEYIAQHYNLPGQTVSYGAVAENWPELREIVVRSMDIDEMQRQALLQLIDSPAYGPADYDAKERTLKTDRRFASLYRDVLLPVWFPQLRATKFTISTRLRPLSDVQLAEVINNAPEKMSLNQMFRVAMLYPQGSPEFTEALLTAARYYPDDQTSLINAANALLMNNRIEEAKSMLDKADASPEAENARGIIATYEGDFPSARLHFEAAGELSEAKANILLLGE